MKNLDLTVPTLPMEIRFSIVGSFSMDKKTREVWKDLMANPLPKLRMTRAQSWKPEVKRYIAWKEHVATSFIDALGKISPGDAANAARNYAAVGRPLLIDSRRARMDIVITWTDGAHGDPENVFGSIADALFHNDKNLAGSFDFNDEPGEAKVDILLTISEQRTWTQKRKRSIPSESRQRDTR